MSAVSHCVESILRWRAGVYPQDGPAISASDQRHPQFLKKKQDLQNTLDEILLRFEKEIPKFSPRYIGHMFSEISIPALLGHLVALLHNPNNVSGESSRVGVQIERDAVQALLTMVGYDSSKGAGHFTSGGTIANFEAVERATLRTFLWLSRPGNFTRKRDLFQTAHRGWRDFDHSKAPRIFDFREDGIVHSCQKVSEHFDKKFEGPVFLVPEHRHYSWHKAASNFGFGKNNLWPVELDSRGRLSVKDLRKKIDQARHRQIPILMVVSLAGSTELGTIDPVNEVAALLKEYETKHGLHIWHHVDAAYGGFLTSIGNKSSALSSHSKKALSSLCLAQSVTLDPHKLGYVPFASGTFLTQSKRDYFLHNVDAPYLQFKKFDLGPQTIEGSRSAAGSAATWMTLKSIGLGHAGYGRILEKTLQNSKIVEAALNKELGLVRIVPNRDSNILCFCLAKNGESLTKTNERTLKIYKNLSPENNGPFIVSKTQLRWKSYPKLLKHFTSGWRAKQNVDSLILIRLTLMNPFLNSRETRTSFIPLFISILKDFDH